MRKISVLIFIVVLTNSCGLMKKLPPGSPEGIKMKDLLEQVDQNQNEYQNLRFQAAGKYSSSTGESFSFKLQVRILKDSIVWIDIADPILGIKLAKAIIFRDSVAFVNKIERKFYTGKVSNLMEKIDLDLNFEILQHLLSANILFPLLEDQYELYYEKDAYLMADYSYDYDSTEVKPESQSHLIKIDPVLKKAKYQNLHHHENKQDFTVQYSDFHNVLDLTFPTSLQLNYVQNGQKSVLILNKIKNIQKDIDLKFSLRIPSHYERML